MANMKRTGLLDLLNLKTAVFMGILASTLVFTGCPQSSQGAAGKDGAAGTPGAPGPSGKPGDLASRQTVSVSSKAELNDEPSTAGRRYSVRTYDLDGQEFAPGASLPRASGVTGDNAGNAEVEVLIGALNVVDVRSLSGELLGSYLFAPGGGESTAGNAQTARKVIKRPHGLGVSFLIAAAGRKGFKDVWNQADIDAILEGVANDSKIQDAWDTSAAELTQQGPELFAQVLRDNPDWLIPLTESPACWTSVSPTQDFRASGVLADGDSLRTGDATFVVENGLDECVLATWDTLGITSLIYTILGNPHTDINGAGGDNTDVTVDCKKFKFDQGALSGVVAEVDPGTSADVNSVGWYASRLANTVPDADNAAHKDISAVAFGLFVDPKSSPDDDVNVMDGDGFTFNPPGADAVFFAFQSNQDEDLEPAENNLDETTHYLAMSAQNRCDDAGTGDADGFCDLVEDLLTNNNNAIVWLYSKGHASEDIEFTAVNDGTSSEVMLSLNDDYLAAADGETGKRTHISFLVVRVGGVDGDSDGDAEDAFDTDTDGDGIQDAGAADGTPDNIEGLKANLVACQEHMSESDAMIWGSNLTAFVSSDGELLQTPYDIARMFASTNCLGDKRVFALGGDEKSLGHEGSTLPNFAMNAGASNIKVTAKLPAGAEQTLYSDEFGFVTGMAALKAGDQVTFAVEGGTDRTATCQ